MIRILAIGVAAAFLVGCSDSSRRLGTVDGTVTFEGEPIPVGSIIFEVSGARPATGKIEDGKITQVTTFEPNDGVPVGQADVAIYAAASADTASAVTESPDSRSANPGSGYMGSGQKSLIPDRYNNPATSQLNCEIKPGENHVEFELKKK